MRLLGSLDSELASPWKTDGCYSCWRSMTQWCSAEFGVGTSLVCDILYVNDLEVNLDGLVGRFADNTKIG